MQYEEIEGVIEDLVRIKSKKFSKGFLSQDDIAQEIRLKCFLSMDAYDPSMGKTIKTYLNVCTENHLKNLMRDKFAKFDPPCRRRGCPHYDVLGKPTDESYRCPSFVKYMEKYARKCASRMPCSIEDSWGESSPEVFSSDEISSAELNLSIIDCLQREFPENAPQMISYYQDMVAGKKILKSAKAKIQRAVAELIGNGTS